MRYQQELPEHAVDRRDYAFKPHVGMARVQDLRKLLKQFDQDCWDRCCRAMQIHVMHDNVEGAISALRYYMKSFEPPLATLDSPLITVLPDKIANALETVNLFTVKDALEATESQLLAIDNLGAASIKQIQHTCQAVLKGELLELRPDDLETSPSAKAPFHN